MQGQYGLGYKIYKREPSLGVHCLWHREGTLSTDMVSRVNVRAALPAAAGAETRGEDRDKTQDHFAVSAFMTGNPKSAVCIALNSFNFELCQSKSLLRHHKAEAKVKFAKQLQQEWWALRLGSYILTWQSITIIHTNKKSFQTGQLVTIRIEMTAGKPHRFGFFFFTGRRGMFARLKGAEK